MSRRFQPTNILDLNDDALKSILSHLSFDEVAQIRLVCRRFNDISQVVLNSGFARIQRYRIDCEKEVKALLPRRESERRIHRLHPHLDILSSVEMRLSTLSMTYDKNKATCFIPGKVLDECSRVLREVMGSKHQLNSSQVLREFRDLCSMAVEHFDEKILPVLKRKQKNLMDHRYPVPIRHTALCVNQVLTLGKDQLQAQQNSLPSLSQPTSLSQLETKLKDCEQKCNAQEQEISQLKKNGAEQAKELKELSKKWIEWEQQGNPKPAVTAIPALSKQTAAAKSATPASSSKSDSSQKFDSIQAIPKQPVGVTLATRSSKPSAPEFVPLKPERRASSIALRGMIERKIRPSEVFLFGSVSFSVNQSLTIEGIVIPTQLFSSNLPGAVYKENLRFFLKDGNGNKLAASSLYEGLTHRETLLSLYFKRPLFIQSHRNYVIDLHISSAGSYPLGVVSNCVSTSEGVRFLFGHTSTSNAFEQIENELRSGLIRGILFSV